jgi:hypothetical protein
MFYIVAILASLNLRLETLDYRYLEMRRSGNRKEGIIAFFYCPTYFITAFWDVLN